MKSIANATLLYITCLLLTSATVQTKQQVYLQLVDPAGQPIRGTSVDRGYERQIIATAFSGYTAGNSQLRFSMPSGSASAALANLQGSGQKLPSAVFTITEPGEARPNVVSSVRLEDVAVKSVNDANGSTAVVLQASRIGVTYFQNNRKTGERTVSGKTGYDFTTKQPWNSF
ncbi:MAG TPA: hypothetical protein VMR70_10485 [Flavisolibacter sp.]|nr:hypothetical protein [Flavisolibacter sp.]